MTVPPPRVPEYIQHMNKRLDRLAREAKEAERARETAARREHQHHSSPRAYRDVCETCRVIDEHNERAGFPEHNLGSFCGCGWCTARET